MSPEYSGWKTTFLLKWPPFQRHVSFQGRIYIHLGATYSFDSVLIYAYELQIHTQ